MSRYEWSDEKYATEISRLDEQHKVLFKIINEIYEKYEQRATYEEISNLMDEMRVWIKTHFTEEEIYLKTLKEPGVDVETHINIHNKLLSTFLKIQSDFSQTKTLTPHFFNFIEQWLENHIHHVDMQYSPTKSRFKKNQKTG